MKGVPNTWWMDELDGESRVLLGLCLGLLHLVVPPGEGFGCAEPNDERAMWRWVIWIGDEDNPPAVCVDLPHSISYMGTREVVERLPHAHHDFVRVAMARQMYRAVTFGTPPPGQCPEECHARSAGQALAWLADELAEAFPDESWYRLDVESIEIPSTAEELLRLVPGPQSERLSQLDVIESSGRIPGSAAINRQHSILPRGGY
jgi:hypothetical protein